MATIEEKKDNSVLQDVLNCAICQYILYKPVSLACGHSVCKDCISNVSICPYCRRNITYISDINIVIQDIVKNTMDKNEYMKYVEEREKIITIKKYYDDFYENYFRVKLVDLLSDKMEILKYINFELANIYIREYLSHYEQFNELLSNSDVQLLEILIKEVLLGFKEDINNNDVYIYKDLIIYKSHFIDFLENCPEYKCPEIILNIISCNDSNYANILDIIDLPFKPSPNQNISYNEMLIIYQNRNIFEKVEESDEDEEDEEESDEEGEYDLIENRNGELETHWIPGGLGGRGRSRGRGRGSGISRARGRRSRARGRSRVDIVTNRTLV